MPNNVLDLAAELRERRQQRQPPSPPGDGDRTGVPVIQIIGGQLPQMIDAAEEAMIVHDETSTDGRIYRFGGQLVRVAWDKIRVAGGDQEDALRHSVINTAALIERFTKAADWQKWSKTENKWTSVDCPKQVAESYLARDGNWRISSLLGVITAPTLRSDNTLITAPGYDEATGLVFDPLGVDFGEINTNPTKDDANSALSLIKDNLLKYFPFKTNADRSVAISGILTAVVRQAMPVAPMHAFDAPVAGSGKSMLVDVAALIATGHRAAVMASGDDGHGDGEFEKRLAAAALGGDAIVSLDNLEQQLSGQLLCQLLTQHAVMIRPFRTLTNVMVPSTATYFANGNNLVVSGDLIRRVLVARIDPRVERPELERYPFNPLERAKEERVDFLKAALMIVLARIKHGGPAQEDKLGSYERWSYLVRDALTWLGEPDPLSVMELTRSADPRLERLREMMSAWTITFGDRPVKSGDVIHAANERVLDEHEERYRYPDLRQIVQSVAIGKNGLSPDKLGWWLKRNLDRTVTIDGVSSRFTSEPKPGHGVDWRLVRSVSSDDPPF